MEVNVHPDHGFEALVGGGLKIHLFGELHQQVAHHGFENGGQEFLLVAEIVVERGGFDANLLCKRPKRHRFVAIRGNQIHASSMNG
ncbi:hypothetical protein D3C81_1359940 [compost metagenome]